MLCFDREGKFSVQASNNMHCLWDKRGDAFLSLLSCDGFKIQVLLEPTSQEHNIAGLVG